MRADFESVIMPEKATMNRCDRLTVVTGTLSVAESLAISSGPVQLDVGRGRRVSIYSGGSAVDGAPAFSSSKRVLSSSGFTMDGRLNLPVRREQGQSGASQPQHRLASTDREREFASW